MGGLGHYDRKPMCTQLNQQCVWIITRRTLNMRTILQVLSFFKVIPGLKNKYADGLGLMSWSVVSMTAGAVMVVKDVPLFQEAATASTAYLISLGKPEKVCFSGWTKKSSPLSLVVTWNVCRWSKNG